MFVGHMSAEQAGQTAVTRTYVRGRAIRAKTPQVSSLAAGHCISNVSCSMYNLLDMSYNDKQAQSSKGAHSWLGRASSHDGAAPIRPLISSTISVPTPATLDRRDLNVFRQSNFTSGLKNRSRVPTEPQHHGYAPVKFMRNYTPAPCTSSTQWGL